MPNGLKMFDGNKEQLKIDKWGHSPTFSKNICADGDKDGDESEQNPIPKC